MAIYFPDGNGGRRVISAADISLEGFSGVAGATGAITDADNLLTALAKLYNGGVGGGSKIVGTITLTANKRVLPSSNATAVVGVTTNSGGTVTAKPADSSICNAVVETTDGGDTQIKITGFKRGATSVTVTVGQNGNYTAASDVVVVDVNYSPIDMLSGRTLAQLQTIFHNGQAAQHFKPGDYFDVTFASDVGLDSDNTIAANSTYRAVLLGIDHNSDIEGSNRGHFCIGQLTDGNPVCFFPKQMNPTATNAGGWSGSHLKTWLNDTFYNALPNDLKNVITSCSKYTDNVGKGFNTSSSVTLTSQKIWLISEFEFLGYQKGANENEQDYQKQYDYYKNASSWLFHRHDNDPTANIPRWSRSPTYSNTTGFRRLNNSIIVNEAGKLVYTPTSLDTDANSTANYCGVVPCFTIS